MANLEAILTRLEQATIRLESLSNGSSFAKPAADATGVKPALAAFDSLISGEAANFLKLGTQIGGLVQEQAVLFLAALGHQRALIEIALGSKKPASAQFPVLLKPLQDVLAKIAQLKDSNRASPLFSHLSCVADGSPALGWVCVEPAPTPFVGEMKDAAQFYANRVIKEQKEKEPSHIVYVKSFLQLLVEIQAYVKQHHTTGLAWNGKGGDVSAFKAGTAPATVSSQTVPNPTASIAAQTATLSKPAAAIDITGNLASKLRKVDASEMTHKNPELRQTSVVKASAPAVSSPTPTASKVAKPPKLELQGNKWVVENQKNRHDIVLQDLEIRHVVYIYNCEGCTITIKGKLNAVTLDSCKKTGLVVDTVLSSLDTVNCKSVQLQILGLCQTIAIDKTDGFQLYVSRESLGLQILSAKSSEMNVLWQKNGDEFVEEAVCEQFLTQVGKNGLITTPVEHHE